MPSFFEKRALSSQSPYEDRCLYPSMQPNNWIAAFDRIGPVADHCESVTAAATVDEALSLIDTQAFDVAMLNMNLDGNKSHDVADALAARGMPFVFSTGYSSLEMKAYRGRPLLKKAVHV
jgi:hypothetical protein